nr:UDP-N-acetylglucosamine 2-epimerase [Pseudomonas sp. s4]
MSQPHKKQISHAQSDLTQAHKKNIERHFVFIIGTRAQLIKVAPVIVECENRGLPCTLLMTGQHLETMQDLLDEFGVRSIQLIATPAKENATILSLLTWLPKSYLGIKKQLTTLSSQNKSISVLVHGDTLSTVLGALAGRQTGASVVHLESGLTSKKLFDPFPEEISRRIVFRLSDIAMCPTTTTAQHMQRKHPNCKILNTNGNTILDSVKLTGITRNRNESDDKYIVASLHRFQNIYNKERLTKLIAILESISKNHTIYFVLHPATRKRLIKNQLENRLKNNKNIKLTPRLGYTEFLKLAANSACVITDGGSNQEELAALGVPTIIMRQATERSDGLGDNAVMENDISGGTVEYIKERKYETLENKRTPKLEESPSSLIMEYLVALEKKQ